MTWNPYSLKKPCANCPFLKDVTKAIPLQEGRVEGIIEDLLAGKATSFSCHKTVYEGKTTCQRPEHDWKQCAGSLIVLQKLGHSTELMTIMQRLGVYNPADFEPYHDLVIDYQPKE